jgi:hypothetical protein
MLAWMPAGAAALWEAESGCRMTTKTSNNGAGNRLRVASCAPERAQRYT